MPSEEALCFPCCRSLLVRAHSPCAQARQGHGHGNAHVVQCPFGTPTAGIETINKQRQRIEPETRKRTIIEATLKCVTRYGHAGTTMTRVAREAGASIGLVSHYFQSKESLMLAAYQELTEQLRRESDQRDAALECSARERLTLMIRSAFKSEIFNQQVLASWVGFWSAAVATPSLASLNRKLYEEYREEMQSLVEAIAIEEGRVIDAKGIARILTALVDGYWLEWALDPEAFKVEEALQDSLEIAERLLRD
ncbi:transcriptional regulator BetI [Chromohalobacter israelensis]|uniref:transcriptional regulator BetI n=1 Tax=Chromohalobacter israelensis TaxID=141390 RepID=UPI000FFF3355|nr:transcriptional regulator BetI [Chromohalobacter salexigens]RXE46624.1 transcriptional regulator BetI [Chromohalobacter salexigens]